MEDDFFGVLRDVRRHAETVGDEELIQAIRDAEDSYWRDVSRMNGCHCASCSDARGLVVVLPPTHLH